MAHTAADDLDDSLLDHRELDIVIEVPRGSFLKRGSSGRIDFVSPWPCPFNYGAVPTDLGMEGDLLDALMLGPRLRYGTTLRATAWGAITLTDRGMQDDKLVCADHRPSAAEIDEVLRFFHLYARCKGWLNRWRRRPGRNACEGWCSTGDAMRCAARVRCARAGRDRTCRSELRTASRGTTLTPTLSRWRGRGSDAPSRWR